MAASKKNVGARPYEGDLAKRLPRVRGLGIRVRGEVTRAEPASIEDRKMLLLFDHFGLPPGDWRQLAFRLAQEHVPGFKLSKGNAGRPKVWTPYAEMAVEAAREGVKEGLPHLSAHEREKWLAQQYPFVDLLKPNDKRRPNLDRLADALRKHGRKTAKQTAGKAPKALSPRKDSARLE